MQKEKALRFSRRQIMMGAASTLAMPTLLKNAFAAETITVADPGGPFNTAYRKAFYDPFEKETGIRIANVAREAQSTAQFLSMVQTKSYIWDVCTITASMRATLNELGVLDPTGVKPEDAPGLMKQALYEDFVGIDIYCTVMAYRADILKNGGPKNWVDFWNVENFPGRRCLRKHAIDTLEQALMADGVSPADLYPLDLDRAFKSLDRIKPHIDVWWTGGAQSTQLLQSGEVAMISGWNARLQTAIDGGVQAKIEWDQGLYSIEGWAIPKGSPKGDMARAFIKFCTRPEQQALITETLAYGPTNTQAYDHIPTERAKVLPTSPENLPHIQIANEAWWAKNQADVTERFNTWLLF